MKNWLMVLLILPGVLGAQESKAGDWRLATSVDPMTDAVSSVAVTEAISGDIEKLAGLGMRCGQTTGFSVVLSGSYWGGGGAGHVVVRWRVDDLEPTDGHYWYLAGGNRVAILTSMLDDWDVQFVQQAGIGKKILVRVTDPTDDEVRTSTFSLDGFKEALEFLPCRPKGV